MSIRQKIREWLGCSPVIVPSMTYWEEHKKAIDMLDARVKKLELRAQLKDSGLAKALAPVPAVHASQRQTHKKHVFLSLDQVHAIEDSIAAGWSYKQIMAKYGVSYATVSRINDGHHPLSKKK